MDFIVKVEHRPTGMVFVTKISAEGEEDAGRKVMHGIGDPAGWEVVDVSIAAISPVYL
jgi:hypothetical protein